MESTTLYYFFSTVSQTLAGLVGLLGAFTVLRLSDLEGRSVRALDTLEGQTATDLSELRVKGDIGAILRNLDTELAGLGEGARGNFRRPLVQLRRSYEEKLALYASSKQVLLSTGAAIEVALIGILSAEVLASSGGVAAAAVLIQFMVLVWTARSYWRLAMSTIGG